MAFKRGCAGSFVAKAADGSVTLAAVVVDCLNVSTVGFTAEAIATAGKCIGCVSKLARIDFVVLCEGVESK